MLKKNHMAFAVSSALGLSAAMGLPSISYAQEQALEEVVITGSRIIRNGFTSSSPLSVFDENDITIGGNATVDEFLKNVPQFTGYQMGGSTNNGSDTGQKKIDLRGLGFERTLVLVNGRRQLGDTTADGAVDLNTIPEAMIKRVEVLTDGASTIYGSDALAGVVNFVLHDDFEGFRVTGNYGAGTEDWDAENKSISILAGVGSDRGNMVFSAAYSSQEELLQADRDFSNATIYSILQPNGGFKLEESGSSNSRRIRVPDQGNWIYDSAAGSARPFESTDIYDYSPVNALTQPNERWQFGTNGKVDLNQHAQAYFEGYYTRRTSQQRLAPDASFAVSPTIETPNNGLQWNDFVPANNPFNPFGSVNCAACFHRPRTATTWCWASEVK